MNKVRIVYKSDGKVSIIHPAPKSRRIRPIKVLEILAHDTVIELDGKVIKIPKASVLYLRATGQAYVYAETEEEWLERVFSKAMKQPQSMTVEGPKSFEDLGYEYDDIDESQLPQSREDRDAWRGSKGNSIWVDQEEARRLKDEKINREKINKKMRQIAIQALKKEGELPPDYMALEKIEKDK